MLPEAFLATDEMLRIAVRMVNGLQIDREAMARNLATYSPFAAVERLLMALGKAGADRQEMHERLRVHAMKAWSAIQTGAPNPLLDDLLQDSHICAYLSKEELRALMDASQHVGNAPARARALAAEVRMALA